MPKAGEPENTKLDVLVVGAGPVGLMMAITVAAQGLRCRIIDAAPEPEKESRAIGIQSRTLETFEMAGCVEQFLERGHLLQAFNLYGHDGRRILHIEFSELPSRYRYLMTLPQEETERILTQKLQALGVPVERPTRLISFEQSANRVSAKLETRQGETELSCDWLIGCDGAHSRVREQLGLQFAGKTYDLQFLLGDMHVETALTESEGHGFGRPNGLLAVFPLGGQRWRLIADYPEAGWEQREKPSLEEWQRLVDARASVPMRLSDPNWTAYFRVNARIVEKLRDRRVFVLGDAAHIHSPALAQGMNTGLQDAWNLGWKLALVQKGLAKPTLIDSFEAERLPVEQNVLKITDFTQTVVANTDRRMEALRDFFAPLAAQIPFIAEKARERISELNVSYRKSPIVENSLLPAGPAAGERAPDAEIRVGGETRRLFSLFGREHVLLVMSERKSATAEPQRLELAQQTVREMSEAYGHLMKAYLVFRDPRGEAPVQGDVIFDIRGEIARRYGGITALYLVRPDGYIAYRSGVTQVEKLKAYLQKWYLADAQSGNRELRAG